VHFTRTSGADAPGTFQCGNVMRVAGNPGMLYCTLPEGSGTALDAVVTVADQATTAAAAFTYLPPVVTSVRVAGGAMQPIMNGLAGGAPVRGDSIGSYAVELWGDNFGSWNYTFHCLFVSWRARDRNDFACDHRMGFLGEGEVPWYGVTNWTHTYVRFMMPPGLGTRDFLVSVRGQRPVTAPVFHYGAPWLNVTTVTPRNGPTDGGTLITLRGRNFGNPAVDTSQTGPSFPIAYPATWDEFIAMPTLPTSQLRVNFFRSCFTGDVFDVRQARNPRVDGCAQRIVGRTHDYLAFLSAPGIGVNRTINVTWFDREPLPGGGPLVDVSYTSNAVAFHYDPPLVTDSQPIPLYMEKLPRYKVTFGGVNFGRPAPDWSPEELAVTVTVGGRMCEDPFRYERSGRSVMDCYVGEFPVGRHNVSYVVAGQAGFTNETWDGHVFTVCKTNYFGLRGEVCLSCPEGATCAGYADRYRGGIEGNHTYPVPKPTFFNLNGTMAEACSPDVKGQYPGRDVCIVACEPPEACLADNVCAEPYRSTAPYYRCSTCNLGFYRRNGECVKCPDSPYAVIIGFVALVVVAGVVAYVLNKRKINIAFISIGIDYFQVLAIFAQSRVAWPAAIKELFHILSAFNLNIEIVAPECIVPDVSFKQKWIFVMLLPVCLGALFVVVHLAMLFYKAVVKGRRGNLSNHSGTMIAGGLALFYILYLYLTRTILEVFNCAPTAPPDGYEYLSAVFERCGVPGGTQLTLMPGAVICLIGYTFGYPAFLAGLFYFRREVIMEDQLLRAKGQGDDHLTNPHAYPMRKAFGRAYYQFKPDYYFWVLAIILRKFFIAFTSLMFRRSGAFQLAASLLIMFLAYAAQVKWNPYMSPQDFEGVLKSHVESSFTSPIHARLRATLANIDSRGRKRTHRNVMSKDGKVDYGAVLGILTSWLFNYNTVSGESGGEGDRERLSVLL